MLTVRAANGTMFCDPIGHRQVDGDYVESWQPHAMSAAQIAGVAGHRAAITDRAGRPRHLRRRAVLLPGDKVMFSEVTPRPHDTGLVTMATQVWSEFALHARAILGLPIPSIRRHAAGASVALRAEDQLASPMLDGVADRTRRRRRCPVLRQAARRSAAPARRGAGNGGDRRASR